MFSNIFGLYVRACVSAVKVLLNFNIVLLNNWIIAMDKGMLKDRVLKDARNRAFNKANLKSIWGDDYDVSVESGKVILKAKRKTKKNTTKEND